MKRGVYHQKQMAEPKHTDLDRAWYVGDLLHAARWLFSTSTIWTVGVPGSIIVSLV